jgi:hypothetical protein
MNIARAAALVVWLLMVVVSKILYLINNAIK